MFQASTPESEATRWYGEGDFCTKTVAVATRSHLRPREKCQVSSGMTFRIRIEKVVSRGVILVHTPLHQTHPEHARIKIEIFLRRSCDGSNVMKSSDVLHTDGMILDLDFQFKQKTR